MKKNRQCYAVYQRKLSSLVTDELNCRVEDHHCSKTGLLPSLVGQKCDEGWLIRTAWTPCKSDIDMERWFSSICLHANKFSEQQDRQLVLMTSRPTGDLQLTLYLMVIVMFFLAGICCLRTLEKSWTSVVYQYKVLTT